ncbi:MAG: LAGLIDADG family homing endonuclease [Candidatus Margulisbacteria bacterium]|nr:LAGLIDADG family homing endonuclease [Candidatus Margulisiibacteriota bacterium]MBU1021174.1 LAGLIDADG family homing endonuclease [Candidatus Margulisiibacteriota bacterium]MBU1729780.1 LAGLIDADG family homing endonuclease [Candidatus Margulisiibacteriota bacterium]MBU1955281.1 LAGLIDADG family homing endonuclease [Candidatus Margulisiibacteriota bacterium]
MGKQKIINTNWNSNLAYVVGLITTDGCLSSDGRHIDITSKDPDLLETAMDCLEIKIKIGKKSDGKTSKIYHRIQIGSISFYNWLVTLGLTPRKSLTLGPLKIPDTYFLDFLRGHFDGDGTYRIYKDYLHKNCQRIYSSFLSGSLEHIIWLQGKIQFLLDISGIIIPDKRVWELKYAKKESLVLIPAMYHNSAVPCLRRKRDKIEFILPRW